MSTAAATPLAATLRTSERLRDLAGIYAELSKSRLSMMVVLTAVVGFVMAGGPIHWFTLLLTVLGVGLAAGSANAFNEILERERDRLMDRTQGRPLPAHRIGTAHALAFAWLTGVVGVGVLYFGVNRLSAAMAAGNLLLYVCVYTPLKVRTTLNTLVGAVVGAIPPMIGWAGAGGTISAGAWVLAAILFAWQMPHFLALAWMYREQYERGGFRMLPSVDPTGRLTCGTALLYTLALLPLTLAATMTGMTGWIFGFGAMALGGWMVALGIGLMQRRTQTRARRLFLASVIYLPLLMGLMVFDRTAAHSGPEQSAAVVDSIGETG